MSKPRDINEAIQRARDYGTPTYLMLVEEIERLRRTLDATDKSSPADLAQTGEQLLRKQ